MGTRPSEFDLIARYFSLGVYSEWHSQGIGDDCAIIKIGPTKIAVTTDTTALGTHFLPDADPVAVGYKALAVNLSDLAAAGASPRAFFLAISLPEVDDVWLTGFSEGLRRCAQEFDCELMGGDTTRSTLVDEKRTPTTITITAMGEIEGQGLRRDGAQVGDDIWVTGTVGDAYAALMMRTGVWSEKLTEALAQRMDYPRPRVTFSREVLVSAASACADVSDGLAQDLGHILDRSGVGAKLWIDAPAVSEDLAKIDIERRRQAQWAGGDDYELVFTANPQERGIIEPLGRYLGVTVTRIGEVVSSGICFLDADGVECNVNFSGFDHFRDAENA